MTGDEFGILRQRVAALRERRRNRDAGTAAQTVIVYNAGSMPSTVPAFYACHPVNVGGAETEGGAGTLTTGAGLIPVMVIRGVPAAGDYLEAYRIGGRWVAERGKTGPPPPPPPPPPPTCTCATVPISTSTLHLAVAGGSPGVTEVLTAGAIPAAVSAFAAANPGCADTPPSGYYWGSTPFSFLGGTAYQAVDCTGSGIGFPGISLHTYIIFPATQTSGIFAGRCAADFMARYWLTPPQPGSAGNTCVPLMLTNSFSTISGLGSPSYTLTL